MSYHRHDAIVVTSWNQRGIDFAREKAKEMGLKPTQVVELGDHWSFLIPPDGSKENWSDSNDFDEKREQWKDWTKKELGDASEGWVYWVHVRFPGIGDRRYAAEVVEGWNPP